MSDLAFLIFTGLCFFGIVLVLAGELWKARKRTIEAEARAERTETVLNFERDFEWDFPTRDEDAA